MPRSTRASNATAHPGKPDMKRPRRSANEVKAEKEAIADAKKAETAKRKAGIKRIADFQKHLRQQEEEASSAHLHREESPKVAAGLDDTGNGEGSENGGVGAVDFEAAGSDSDEFIPDGLEEPDDFEMDPEEEEPRAKKALPGKSSKMKEKALAIRRDIADIENTMSTPRTVPTSQKRKDVDRDLNDEDEDGLDAAKKRRTNLPSGLSKQWIIRNGGSSNKRASAAAVSTTPTKIKTESAQVNFTPIRRPALAPAKSSPSSQVLNADKSINADTPGSTPAKHSSSKQGFVSRRVAKMDLGVEPKSASSVSRTRGNVTPKEKKKKFNNTDLPLPPHIIRTTWRHEFMPTFLNYVGTFSNPWETATDGKFMEILQSIWDTIFPDHPETHLADGPVYFVTNQRAYEWRTMIGKAACSAVLNLFASNPEYESAEKRAAYVGHSICRGMPCMWQDPEARTGAFRSPLILQTFAAHLAATSGACHSFGNQAGALCLSAVAVERALKLWVSGYEDDEPKAFSETVWGKATASYARSIVSLSDDSWDAILTMADKYIVKPRALSSDAQLEDGVEEDDDRACIVD